MSSSEERCAVLDTDIFDCTDTCEYPDGNWVVTSCTETHPYLCKIKKGKFQEGQMIKICYLLLILYIRCVIESMISKF